MLLGLTALVITVNSFDSGMAKTPLLVLLTSLLVVVYLTDGVWTGELKVRRSPADLPVLGFLALIVASALYSDSPGESVRALELWVPIIICFFAGTHLFRNREAVRRLTQALLVIASAVVLIGLIQFFFSASLVLNFFIGADRRVSSTLTNSTYLSGYLVLLFPFFLTSAMSEPRGSRMRWVPFALLGGLVFVLFVTSTRSSIAAFLVSLLGLVVLLVRTPRKALVWGGSALLLVALAVCLTPRLAERIEASFRDDPSSTFARRTYFWKAGYNAWKAAPFLGHGIGSYQDVMREYRSPDYWVVHSEDLVPHAHNEFIETAVDLGGIGVAVYLSILGMVLYPTLRSRGEGEKKRDRLLKIGLCCSLVAILLDNLTNLSLRVAPVAATAWLFLGVLASLGSKSNPAKVIELRAPRWLILVPLGCWAAFVVIYCNHLWPAYKADGHLIRGSLAIAGQRIPEATSEYRIASTLDPHDALARSNLALLLLEAGHYSEALETANQLQQLSPNYPRTNLIQASALVSLRRYPEALDRIDKELSLRNHPEAYYYQAAAYMGMRDTAREIRSLENILLSDIKGRLNFELAPVSRRLIALLPGGKDLGRLVGVYRQLSEVFPAESIVTSTLATFEARFDSLNR